MMRAIKTVLLVTVILAFGTGCEEPITVKIPSESESVVVEAYVNDWSPILNYVLITKTFSYLDSLKRDLNGITGAVVLVSEGTLNGKDTTWASPVQFNSIPGFLNGYYVNPAFKASQGKVYKLEITLPDGSRITGSTSIPKVVPIDSITQKTVQDMKGDTYCKMTVNFAEPADAGQNYRAMYKMGGDSSMFAWGDIPDSTQFLFNDDGGNGIYRRFEYGNLFTPGDTLQYYLVSMDRYSYNFWESFEAAKNNGGPFATPVQLRSNIKGAIGSFSGFSMSHKQVIFKK